MIRYRTASVGDHELFYREAGKAGHPTLLLLSDMENSTPVIRMEQPGGLPRWSQLRLQRQ